MQKDNVDKRYMTKKGSCLKMLGNKISNSISFDQQYHYQTHFQVCSDLKGEIAVKTILSLKNEKGAF